jgi:ParB-like chromosome segregation protein Spo0J
MKIENLKPEDLKPYKLNAKKHPQSQIEGIAESIKRFGFTQPIVVNKQNEIIIGHGRFEAAKIVGLEKIPCLRLDTLSEQEVKALRLLDNRIAETGWDVELLKMDLQGFDFDFEPFRLDFGDFNSEKIENLNHENEWEGMPEFDHENKTGIQLIVHFKNENDRNEFSKLVGQKFTEKTKYIWYPEAEIESCMDKRYESES